MGYDGKSKISGSVSHADIQACLGVSYTDNDKLCTAAAINGNSFYKPLNSPINFGNGAYGGLSDAERRKYNWGWKMLGGVAGQSTIYEALNAKWDNAVWEKDLPTGTISVSPYRLQDFNGYDHAADTPFKMALSVTELASGATLRFAMNDMAELNYIHIWGYVNTSALNNVGLAVYIGKSKPSASGFYIYMLAGKNAIHTMQEVIADAEKLLNIPATYLNYIGATSGTWYCIPILIADTTGMATVGTNGQVYLSSSSTAKVMVFPTAKMQFSVTAATKPVQKVYVELSDNSNVSYDLATYRITIPSLKFKITNSNSSSYSVSISVAPSSDSIVGSIISGSFASKSVTIAAGASTTVEVVSSTVVWETYIASAYVNVTITVDGASRTEKLQIYSNKD